MKCSVIVGNAKHMQIIIKKIRHHIVLPMTSSRENSMKYTKYTFCMCVCAHCPSTLEKNILLCFHTYVLGKYFQPAYFPLYFCPLSPTYMREKTYSETEHILISHILWEG